MDLRLIDNRIHPLLYRIIPNGHIKDGGTGSQPVPEPAALAPTDDEGRYLAYSDDELNAILKSLDAQQIGASVSPEDQPDPALLASLHGAVTSRTQALAALESGEAPLTLTALAEQVRSARADLATVSAKLDTSVLTTRTSAK